MLLKLGVVLVFGIFYGASGLVGASINNRVAKTTVVTFDQACIKITSNYNNLTTTAITMSGHGKKQTRSEGRGSGRSRGQGSGRLRGGSRGDSTASPQSEATPAASPAYEIDPQLLVRLINL